MMTWTTRITATLLTALAVLALTLGGAAGAETSYVCPKCGLPCDAKSFAAPGICPDCGMTLVAATEAARSAQEPDRKKVAILVFNGAEILDFTGPYEMFGAAGCDVYTVAATKEPVTTAMGLTVIPKFAFGDAPSPDVLVIPGGGVLAASKDEATRRYIKSTTERVAHTMSVCNGAFILASAGLLDGLSATTTYGNLSKLAATYPKVKVVRDRRYVDNGKIITTAGLSAGIDGALHVIAKLFGTGFAQEVALGEEVDWKPSGGFARGALADHEIPDIQIDDLGTWKTLRTEGDTERWDFAMEGTTKLAIADLTSRVEHRLSEAKWTRVSSAGAGESTVTSTWKFTGSDGKPWKGTLKLDGSKGGEGKCTASLAVARAG